MTTGAFPRHPGGQPELSGWADSNRRQHLPTDWDTRRRRILHRDRHICWICGQPGADAVDHITPGDNHTDTNLAAIHQDVAPYCHRTKSSKEGVMARQRRPTEKRPRERHPGLH